MTMVGKLEPKEKKDNKAKEPKIGERFIARIAMSSMDIVQVKYNTYTLLYI